MNDAKMQFIGRYFGRDWFVADDRFTEPGLYYWSEIRQESVRAWKPGVGLDAEPLLREERVKLQDENEGLRVELRKIDELAERLAKVEARQDEFEQRTVELLDRHDERFNAQNAGRHQLEAYLNTRIDKVAEIIGERVSGLVDRMTAIENGDAQDYDYVLKGLNEVRLRAGLGKMEFEHPRNTPTPPADDYAPMQFNWEVAEQGSAAFPTAEAVDAAFAALPPDAHGTIAPGEMERVLQAAARAAFPTGGAPTAEAAADAVLPVPQRGDRVRLEGAETWTGSYAIPDGWYDVIGSDDTDSRPQFQIRFEQRVPWLDANTEALKEVRHADH